MFVLPIRMNAVTLDSERGNVTPKICHCHFIERVQGEQHGLTHHEDSMGSLLADYSV